MSLLRRVLPLALVSLLGAGLAPSLQAETPEELQPTAEHRETLWKILVRLDFMHLRDVKLDDEFSSELLDSYLGVLDPGRWYFLASDVAEFEKLRDQFDDLLGEGELEPAFAMFRRLQERRIAQWKLMEELLEGEFEALSFAEDQELRLDGEDAAWSADQADLDDLWRRRFKNDVLNLRLADQEAEKIQETLSKRYKDQSKRIAQVTSEDVFRVFSNAMTAIYGPHSEYYPPLQAENFDIQMSLSFEGIGALLGNDGEYVRIERIIPGGPAEADGQLKAGDRITGVGQDEEGEVVDVVGWRTDECVKLIRGEKGTTVRLIILPANQADTSLTREIAIVRDQVKLEEQAAQKHVLEIGEGDEELKIGVIELPAFYMDFDAARRGDPNFKSSTRDVAKLLEELKEEGVAGVLVDLRGNSGGSLTEAHDLAGLFLGEVPVVQVRGSQGDIEILEAERGKSWGGPVAVLVDRLSASASEIFAAAIQDTGRGLVIGTQTFGKGTVQNLLPIDQGQLKVTLAKFYRISGGSTQHRGVMPDITFPSLYDVTEVGESALDGALPWDRVNPVPNVKQDSRLQDMAAALQVRSSERTAQDPEFQYLVELLKHQASLDRNSLSLNEATRRSLREQDDEQGLAIENRRRAARGLEPVATWEELRDAEQPDQEIHAFVREAAQILVDSIRLRTAP